MSARDLLIILCLIFGAERSLAFTLVEDISGAGFFDHFEFVTGPDPTKGFVRYVDRPTAVEMGLIAWTRERAKISVQSSEIAPDSGRASIRLSSKTAFTTGLFTIDISHMPEGVGTWPALWSFGPDWPNNGEIDIVEGINDASANQSALHTKSGCKMNIPLDAQKMSGAPGSRDCSARSGCTILGATGSFGPSFNAAGGGVFALLWTTSRISIWFFPRPSIPADIKAGQPHPDTWGVPVSDFALGADCPSTHFSKHHLIINTDFCGTWAGKAFVGPTGKGMDACISMVKNKPTAYANAYWAINSIRAYSVP